MVHRLALVLFALLAARAQPTPPQWTPVQGNRVPPVDDFHLVPPPPRISNPPGPTAAVSVLVSGVARDAVGVRVALEDGTAFAVPANPGFSANVKLFPNELNLITFTSISITQDESAPTVIGVIQDMQGPELIAIDQPSDGLEVIGSSVVVSGRVGDTLTGSEELRVEVNGEEAEVTSDTGTNGTFIVTVPLNAVDVPTVITPVAFDALNNMSTGDPITVTQVTATGSPSMQLLSPVGPQSGVAGTQLASPITVRLTQSDGTTPFEGKLVTFSVVGGSGTIAQSASGTPVQSFTAATDSAGEVSAFDWTLGPEVGSGNHCVSVTSQGVLGDIVVCASATVGRPTLISLTSGNNQQGEVGSFALQPLRVRVTANGYAVAGQNVTFSVITGGGKVNGQSSAIVATGPAGHAQVNFRYGSTPGLNQVVASIGSPPPLPVKFNLIGQARDVSGLTSYAGLVLDNADEPIQGASVTLSYLGNPVASGQTDLGGRFRFDALPVSGLMVLDVDGSTATFVGGADGSSVPTGSFPAMHYEVVVVEGVANERLEPVYLPFLAATNWRSFDNTQDVELTVAGLEGFRIFVQAGSLLDPPSLPIDLSVNQVHFDKIPMPVPDGIDNAIAWTIQPPGLHFDPPIDFEIPNIAGLAPRTPVHIVSFDHDTAAFAIAGLGFVTDDGSLVSTRDLGAGINATGWGTICPPIWPFFDVAIPDPLVGMPGLLPASTVIPVGTGAIRDDACGSGCFDAPRAGGAHAGVDIVGSLGDPVLVAYDGTVVAIESSCTSGAGCGAGDEACGGGYGNFVVVQHTTASPDLPFFYSAYAHLDTVLVAVNDVLLAGDQVGTLGTSGNANPDCYGCSIPDPYLHFELSPIVPPLNGLGPRTDPKAYLTMLGACPTAPSGAPALGEAPDAAFDASLLLRAGGRRGVATTASLAEISGIPDNGEEQTVRGTWFVGDSFQQSFQSGPLSAGQDVKELPLEAPEPERLEIQAAALELDSTISESTSLTVDAVRQNGSMEDVTTGSAPGVETVYVSSNSEIAAVDADGNVTTVLDAGGEVILRASNDGVTGTIILDVVSGATSTTVVGFVLMNGSPVEGVTVTAYPGGNSDVSSDGIGPNPPEGQFTISGVPADEGPITLLAEKNGGLGNVLAGAVSGIVPVPGSSTDGGIIELQTAVEWISDVDGDWDDASNWHMSMLPGEGDYVIIDRPSFDPVVTIDTDLTTLAGTGPILALRCEEPLTVATNGILEVPIPFRVNNAFTLDGGTLRNSTVAASSTNDPLSVTVNGGELDGMILDEDLVTVDGAIVHVTNGLTLNGTAELNDNSTLSFDGTQAFAGVGTVHFDATSPDEAEIREVGGGTLTIGEAITIRGGRGQVSGSGVVINDGLVIADDADVTDRLRFTAASWINRGRLRSTTSELDLGGPDGVNEGSIEIDRDLWVEFTAQWVNRGTVTGTPSKLYLRAVTNEGVVDVTGGVVEFGSSFDPDLPTSNALGSIIGNASTIEVWGDRTGTEVANISAPGGSIELYGSVDLEAGTLSIEPGWRLQDGCEVRDGALVTPGFGPAVSVDPGTSVLDNVSLTAETTLESGSELLVRNGLVLLSEGRPLTLNANSVLNFEGTQALTGDGQIVAAPSTPGNEPLVSISSGTLTIDDSEMQLRAIGNDLKIGLPGQAFVNRGTIRVSTGATVYLDGTGWVNEGELVSVSPGTIRAGGTWTNAGRIDLNGPTSDLVSPDAPMVQTAGETIIAGTLTGDVELEGGILRGRGTIDGNLTNGTARGAPNSAIVAPAVNPGNANELDVTGNYTQLASGRLEVDIEGTDPGAPEFDRLNVSGQAVLDGVLSLSPAGGFTPTEGDFIDAVVVASAIVGTFEATDAPGIPEGLQVDHAPTAVTVRVLDGDDADWMTSLVDADNDGLGEYSSIHAVNEDTLLISSHDGQGPSKGVYFSRSDDGGRTWSTAFVDTSGADVGIWTSISAPDVDNVFVSYKDGNTVLKLAESSDGGAMWVTGEVPDAGASNGGTSIQALDPNTIFIAYRGSSALSVARTSNGGTNWTFSEDIVSGGAQYPSIHALDDQHVFVAHGVGGVGALFVTKTIDGGVNWTSAEVNSSGDGGRWSSIRAIDEDLVFACDYRSSNAALILSKSTTGGGAGTWVQTRIDPDDDAGDFCSLDATDANRVFVSYLFDDPGGHGVLRVAESDDGGSTWTITTVDAALNVGEYTSIDALDENDVFISYRDFNLNQLKFARKVPN